MRISDVFYVFCMSICMSVQNAHVASGMWEITSSSMTESVPLPMPAEITGLLVGALVPPLLAVLVVVVVVGVKVPFGPRPNINEVARRPATFDTSPEIAAQKRWAQVLFICKRACVVSVFCINNHVSVCGCWLGICIIIRIHM